MQNNIQNSSIRNSQSVSRDRQTDSRPVCETYSTSKTANTRNARNKNVLKDTDQQVKYTRNEENIHALVGMKIINTIREEYPELFDKELEERVLHEAVEAYESEAKIIDWMVNGVQEEGLSAAHLKEFIKDRINESLRGINFPPAFEPNNELLKDTAWFNEELLGNNMTDFFHSRPVEYSKKSQSFSARLQNQPCHGRTKA